MIIIIEIILVLAFTGPYVVGIKPFVVTSGSMIPKYPVGSLIYVKENNPTSIQNGDAITFYMTDNVIATHEVYHNDIKNKLFYTQGINNKDQDGNIIKDSIPVKYDSLVGKPILCIPYLGYINKYITTTPGLYIIIFLTVCIILIGTVLEKMSENRR